MDGANWKKYTTSRFERIGRVVVIRDLNKVCLEKTRFGLRQFVTPRIISPSGDGSCNTQIGYSIVCPTDESRVGVSQTPYNLEGQSQLRRPVVKLGSNSDNKIDMFWRDRS